MQVSVSTVTPTSTQWITMKTEGQHATEQSLKWFRVGTCNKTISSSVTFQESESEKQGVDCVVFQSSDMYKEILNNLLVVQMCIKNVQWGVPLESEDHMMVFFVCHGPPCQTHKRQNLKMDVENVILRLHVKLQKRFLHYSKFLFTGHIPFRETNLYTHENCTWKSLESKHDKLRYCISCSKIIPYHSFVVLCEMWNSFSSWFPLCLNILHISMFLSSILEVVVPPLHQAHLHQPLRPPMDL